MEKMYIVLVLLPEEPHIVFYCGNHNNKPLFHEATGLVKRMPLKEAKKVFNAIGTKNKNVTFCLMEWATFANTYQFTATSQDSFIKNSIKTK